jgi:hypothetical protein
VVGSGGDDIGSANFGVRSTVGQASIGRVVSASYDNKAGYWYNPGTTVTGVGDVPRDAPELFALEQNYPNPFNPSTTIRFSVPRPSRVTLRIFDVEGRLVETLLSKEMPAGVHETVWDASAKASGVYFSRLEAPGFVKTRKLVLLK